MPAAICRKVAISKDGGEIAEVWGDSKQTSSFPYIDQYFDGTLNLTRSDFVGSVNVGSEEMVTIDGLVDIVLTVANKKLTKLHIEGPTGVHGRNSDNQIISEKINWAPRHMRRDGFPPVHPWILSQIEAARAGS